MNKRAKLQRDYLRSTHDGRARLIVRAGETLVSLVEGEEFSQPNDEEPQLAELQVGPRIRFDAQRHLWFATTTGYLAIEGTMLRITPLVVVSETREAAFLDLRAPRADEQPITSDEILEALRTSGIKHGLARQRVELAWTRFKSAGSLPSPIRIAQCTDPDNGKPAGIEYSVPVRLTAGLLGDPDEQMDFHERNLITNVSIDDEIGCWLPARAVSAGIGVDGSSLEPSPSGEDIPLRVGPNIATTELDGGGVRLTATIDGMLALDENGVPFVTETLEVDGDVDFETGNIDARGSVVIGGNVAADFLIKATGDITVRGIVEGASLQSQGTITIEHVLLGADSGRIVAIGDIHLNNSQNASVESCGNIHLNGSDTGSQLNCSGNLFAIDGRGALRGGHYQAGGSVKARSLGSDLGAPTLVFAGLDPIRERERQRLRAALKQVRAVERKAARRKQSPPLKAHRRNERKRAALMARLKHLRDQQANDPPPVIVSLEQVHYGVTIHLGHLSLQVESSTDGRRFILGEVSGEIEAHPL